MVDRAPHNDQPITEPSQDRFGIDPFARTLASSILQLASPEGTAIALNGPWGSGKSSAVNLVLYYLKSAIHDDQLVVINFACWWFRGVDQLALAFFHELYARLTTANDTEVLRIKALQRLRDAAKSGDLKKHPELVYLLYRWRDLAEDGGAEVQGWINTQLSNDDMIVTLAKAFTTHGWSHGISDTVAQRTTNINVEGIEAILDKGQFRARVAELVANQRLTGEDAEIVTAYRDGWRSQESGK